MRVPADLLRALAIWSIRDHQNQPCRRDIGRLQRKQKCWSRAAEEGRGLFFAKAIKSYHFSATTAGRFFRLFAFGSRSRRARVLFFFRLTCGDGHRWTRRRSLLLIVRGRWLLDICGRRTFVTFCDFFELQTKLNRRIEKAVDGLKRHGEPLRNSAE